MNYGKIKTYSRHRPVKQHHTGRKAGVLVVLLALIGLTATQVAALSSQPSVAPAAKTAAVTKTTAKKVEAVKPAENASVAPTPAPEPVIDPNHCEPGRYWRADNYECIDKPQPIIEAPAPSKAVYTPPTVQTVAPVVTGGTDCELARSLIAQYDWNQSSAYAVMYQESSCNTMATNAGDVHGSCLGSYGLFQISCENGVIYDAAANVAQAYRMYQARGWQPWGFTTCKIVACN